jgi:hypothetical protein
MGSISGGIDSDVSDFSTADMVLSEDYDLVGDDVSAILEMNREADSGIGDELNIGASNDPVMDDDLIDFSNPTRDEKKPLESNFSDWLNNNKDKLKDLPGGQGSGPKPLGDSGSLKLADRGLVGAKGFSEEKNPYAAPKYYTPQGSVEFQKMVSGLLSNVFGSSIRKPTIRSLI